MLRLLLVIGTTAGYLGLAVLGLGEAAFFSEPPLTGLAITLLALAIVAPGGT